MDRKKMRKIQRSTHDDDDNDRSHESLDHIPHDLIAEILSRLPTKSIVRSRSVSKLWSSITTTPNFINSFATRSSSQPCVLLIFSKLDKLFVFSSPIHQNNTHPPPPPHQTESYQFTIPNNGHLRRYDSVHGLIYFETSTQLMIWNPTLKRFFTLREPQGCEGQFRTKLLGYDPIDCKYKALCIFRGCMIGILTLGAQESWRVLPKGFPLHCVIKDCVLCINGVIYFTVILKNYHSNGLSVEHGIMSFDLQSEKFRLIKYPMDNHKSFSFVSYERRLALMISSNGRFDGRSSFELWILEDAENHQWVYKHFPPPQLPYTIWILRGLRLKGVTDAGEFIYVSTPYSTNLVKSPSNIDYKERSSYECFDILYFDPKKNSSRQVKLRGIGYDDFERLRLYRSDIMKDLTVVPNHIESLMSL